MNFVKLPLPQGVKHQNRQTPRVGRVGQASGPNFVALTSLLKRHHLRKKSMSQFFSFGVKRIISRDIASEASSRQAKHCVL